jgi:hypothetical protein
MVELVGWKIYGENGLIDMAGTCVGYREFRLILYWLMLSPSPIYPSCDCHVSVTETCSDFCAAPIPTTLGLLKITM